MITDDDKLVSFLRANDPATGIDAARLAGLHNRLYAKVCETKQETTPSFAPFFGAQSGARFVLVRGVVFAVSLILLGLFAGLSMENTPSPYYTAQVSADSRLSILAVAEPWAGWIEERK